MGEPKSASEIFLHINNTTCLTELSPVQMKSWAGRGVGAC
jgi:hypothetical protein